MIQSRITKLDKKAENYKDNGVIVYWITREFRTQYNWSLFFAQQLAIQHNQQLIVLVNLMEEKNIDYIKPFNFFIEGLSGLVKNFLTLNIPVHFSNGNSKNTLPVFFKQINASAVVTDFFPLRYYQNLVKNVADNTNIPFFEIDAHNIVPVKIASNKQEFGAYTIRPKINRLLSEYLTEIPKPKYHNLNNHDLFNHVNNNYLDIVSKIYNKNQSIDWIKSGEDNAQHHLDMFIKQRLENYSADRNNPVLREVSDLSPYIHYGHISAQRIALAITEINANKESKDSFLEELIIRRELSDNFCFYNKAYDSFDGIHPWAKKTLDEHRSDKREYVYSTEQFENAATHDNAWNAAQIEMVTTGKMHGYMRMYWAKKILEWTPNPEEAIVIAIYLNDKYELDGFDPNGYVGILWSIGGVHDRAWNERSVFGKIRYMNYAGLKRKFNITEYENKWLNTSLF